MVRLTGSRKSYKYIRVFQTSGILEEDASFSKERRYEYDSHVTKVEMAKVEIISISISKMRR